MLAIARRTIKKDRIPFSAVFMRIFFSESGRFSFFPLRRAWRASQPPSLLGSKVPQSDARIASVIAVALAPAEFEACASHTRSVGLHATR